MWLELQQKFSSMLCRVSCNVWRTFSLLTAVTFAIQLRWEMCFATHSNCAPHTVIVHNYWHIWSITYCIAVNKRDRLLPSWLPRDQNRLVSANCPNATGSRQVWKVVEIGGIPRPVSVDSVVNVALKLSLLKKQKKKSYAIFWMSVKIVSFSTV